jgi:L-ascorbate metabolism protein UlaG (beta-lactamase superfamily)
MTSRGLDPSGWHCGGRIHSMTGNLRFRWLGTAGIELECRGERLLIDPYLSRFPLRYVLFGRPEPRRDLVKRYLAPARTVLVSHAHYDHVMDVPTVCRDFGATAYGSPNTCAILEAHGIPSGQIQTVKKGDSIAAGPFDIRIFPGRHGRMAGRIPHTGPLPAKLIPPLRLSDYRMDDMFSFLVRAADASILVWNDPDEFGIPRADLLFFSPLWGARSCARTAKAAQASNVVPVHWDDFFSPLERPVRPMIVPPGWRSPWIRRMDPAGFALALNRLLPELKVLIPRIFTYVEIKNKER